MNTTLRRIKPAWLVVLLLAAGVCVVVSCAVGSSSSFGIAESLRALLGGGTTSQKVIVLQLRLPRTLLAFMVGGALAASGVLLQGLFKNPMADPHILGVSAGAGLGATLAMVFGIQMALSVSAGVISVFAFVGGLLAVMLVYGVSRVGGRSSVTGLLLSGVAVSSLLSAMMSLIMISNRDKMEQVLLWTMGSFASASWTKVFWAMPLILAGLVCCMLLARDLNLMLFGEAEARMLGVETGRVRVATLVVSSLMTAGGVAMSGIIGFVGLIVPHAVRLVTGPDHRVLVPASFLCGGIFLLVMDTLARTLVAPLEMPVGVLTAVCGGPFFIYLLRKRGM